MGIASASLVIVAIVSQVAEGGPQLQCYGCKGCEAGEREPIAMCDPEIKRCVRIILDNGTAYSFCYNRSISNIPESGCDHKTNGWICACLKPLCNGPSMEIRPMIKDPVIPALSLLNSTTTEATTTRTQTPTTSGCGTLRFSLLAFMAVTITRITARLLT